MKAYLSHPRPGETYVDPQTEIVVTFEHPYADESDVCIKIDGEWAVVRGRTQPNFVTTRSNRHQDILQWGLRKPGGLEPRDIVIQAWCSADCSTVQQVFYVRGARKECTFYTDKNCCDTHGGIYESEGWPFSDQLEILPNGLLRMDDRVDWIPVVSDTMDAVRLDGAWFAAVSENAKTHLVWPDKIRTFSFPVQSIKITRQWVNAQLSPNKSIHLPIRYVPSPNEISSDDWFSFEHPGQWDMVFGEGIHVWWNKNQLIARHEPDPITGFSNDMLWEKADIGEPFKSVKILDSTHVLVNDHLYLDTYYPDIIEVKIP